MRGTLEIPLKGTCLLQLPPRQGMMRMLEADDRAGSISYSSARQGFVLARAAAFRYLDEFRPWQLYPDLVLDVMQERTLGTQRCDTRCTEAKGNECECECNGEFHGSDVRDSWRQVGITTLVRSNGRTWVRHTITPADLPQRR